MMRNYLYIGQYSDGTTSKMRGDILQELTETTWQVIDTNELFYTVPRWQRSLAFRYKVGPLISKMNAYVKANLKPRYEIIWVDKAIYLTPETTEVLKSHCDKLVHFTPDPAFTFHRSKLFFKALKHYDFAVTTKSFEKNHYLESLKEDQLILVSQGYHRDIHKPLCSFEEKKDAILFIGHYEEYRGEVIQFLLDNQIECHVAGIKWKKFATKNKGNKYLTYLGEGIYGGDYVKTLCGYRYALGLVSTWIPELHTTRTMEIPACKTLLITPRNEETGNLYTDEEALFFSTKEELMEKFKVLQSSETKLKEVINSGYKRVQESGYDYHSILKNVLTKIKSS